MSFSPEPISWEQHVKWFHSKLYSRDDVLLLVTDPGGAPVAQVRYRLGADRAVISICLAAESRGHGYGSAILRMANVELFRRANVDRVDAYVKPHNDLSLRLFVSAGFEPGEELLVSGQRAIHFVLRRNRTS